MFWQVFQPVGVDPDYPVIPSSVLQNSGNETEAASASWMVDTPSARIPGQAGFDSGRAQALPSGMTRILRSHPRQEIGRRGAWDSALLGNLKDIDAVSI